MKVGILTLPIGYNYGGILQNWALQEVLRSFGLRPLTIYYRGLNHRQKIYRWFNRLFVYIIKHIVRHPTRSLNHLPWDLRPYSPLLKFVKQHVNTIDYMLLDTDVALKTKDIKAIIVGSDQVWRPKYNREYLPTMFCDFLNDDSHITAIVYAASFGVSKWEYNERESYMAQKEVAKFKAISVRETSGVKLCKDYLNIDVIRTLDPTLLLTKSDYLKLIPKGVFDLLPEKFMAVYVLDLTQEKKDLIEQIGKELGLEPFYFGNTETDGENLVSVETWLGAIMKSQFVITDSFHGTAFSINFRRPFISIINRSRGADRFISLLQMFDLEDRLIDLSVVSLPFKLTCKSISWDSIARTQEIERKKSIRFLKSNLYACS